MHIISNSNGPEQEKSVVPMASPRGSGFLLTHSPTPGYYFGRNGMFVNPQDSASWMDEASAHALAASLGAGWSIERVEVPSAPRAVLPEGLRPLLNFHQFVMYRLVPSATPGGKPDKIPVNWQNRQKANPHDRCNWASYSTISINGSDGEEWRVGFDLTENDPIAVLDMDGCRDKLTGKLSDSALFMISLLPGAYVEVSVSGTGIHIWFSYSGEMPEHECETEVGGVKREFYHTKRFFALGTPYVAAGFVQGSAAMDHTAMLPFLIGAYFPKKAPRPPVVLGDLEPLSANDRERGLAAFRLACEEFKAIRGTGNGRGNALNKLAINAAAKILRGVFDEKYARDAMWEAAEHFLKDNYEEYVARQIDRGLEHGYKLEPWEPAGLDVKEAFGGSIGALPAGASLVAPPPGAATGALPLVLPKIPPAPLGPAAFHGVVGDFARLVEPTTRGRYQRPGGHIPNCRWLLLWPAASQLR